MNVLFWHLQGQLVSMWQDLSQSELSLNQQLSEFYDTLISTWHSQLQWSSQVRHLSTLLTHFFKWFDSDESEKVEYKLLFWSTGVQEPVRSGDRAADPNSGSHGSFHPRVPEYSLGAGGPRAASRHPAGTPPNHVHLRTQPGGRHAAALGSVLLRQDVTIDGAGVGGVRVLTFCLCVSPQVRTICWRWMSWSVRCMTPTNLISCSMEIWRKLIFSSRSVLYLWLDTQTHTHTRAHTHIYQTVILSWFTSYFQFTLFICFFFFFSSLFRNAGR